MSGPSAVGEIDRGARAARVDAEFWCVHDHRSTVAFSAEAELPEEWPCRICAAPARPVRGTATQPAQRAGAPHKTPYEFMMMRRTLADGERLLDEALRELRNRR